MGFEQVFRKTLDNLPLLRSSSFFALYVIQGSLVLAVPHFLSLRACDSLNFLPICKILVSKIIENLNDRATLS